MRKDEKTKREACPAIAGAVSRDAVTQHASFTFMGVPMRGDEWWKDGSGYKGVPVYSYRSDDPKFPWWFVLAVVAACFVFFFIATAHASEVWKITAYCACVKCCGKSDGITASGKKAEYGMVACNWLPFGTKVHIDGLGDFVVQDRGAKSLFGSKTNHIKHLDVYMPTHREALNFGVKFMEVRYAHA